MLKTKREDICISPSAKVVRLETGLVLTVRLLPQSKSKTVVECSLYGVKTKSEMKAELEKLWQTTKSEINDLEAKYREVLHQDKGVTSCKPCIIVWAIKLTVHR
jgi:hypothetical protein